MLSRSFFLSPLPLLSIQCWAEDKTIRPSASEVLTRIERLWKLEEDADLSEETGM